MFRDRVGVRSRTEIDVMREAGRVVAEMHAACRAAAVPGATTADLDAAARDVLASHGATSNFLGYHGYPAVICASVNDEVVHGIPGERVLHDGDLVSIDCGAVVDGWHGDAAFTMGIGEISDADRHLVEAGRLALEAGIAQTVDGRTLGDLGHAIETASSEAGYRNLRDHCGHGIGRAMHEAPEVLNTGTPGRGRRLQVGNVIAIEPMLCAGTDDYEVLGDGWTVVTADRQRAVHWEHTVAVTEHGPEILTVP